MTQTLYETFRSRVQLQPDQPAVITEDGRVATYGDVLRFIDTTRPSLHEAGINKRTRIGILLPQRAQTGLAFLLIVSTCISAPLNPQMTPDELELAIQGFQLSTLLMGEDTPTQLRERAESLGTHILDTQTDPSFSGFFSISSARTATSIDTTTPTIEDLSVLMQTSGTTSKQKTVPRSHRLQVTQMRDFSKSLGIQSTDRCMNLMPVHHTTGIGSEFLAPLLSGALVVFVEFNPAAVEANVEKHRPTWFNLVPSMHRSLLEKLQGRRDVFKGTSMRFARSSSGMVTEELRARIEQTYGIPLVNSYGSTETGTITMTGVRPGDFKPGSVGIPIHSGIVVTDEDGNVQPAGVPGEVRATGPTVMTGYENNPDANAEAFSNGQYRTGDAAYVDEDGFLFITGRLREVVSRGGQNFSLGEIDAALLKMAGVVEAAAFTGPHATLGHEVYAAVVPAKVAEVKPEQARAHLASVLSWAKVPKRVFIVPSLPINATGKLVRSELEKLLVQ